MAAASPTPKPSGSQLTRRPPTRQGLRRLRSRSQVREEPNGRPSSRNGDSYAKNIDPNDSSDDEKPMLPIELSAYMKALLVDDVAESENRLPARRRSVLSSATNGTTATSGAQTRAPTRETRQKRSDSVRTTRSASTRLSSRPTSRQSSRAPSPQRNRETREARETRETRGTRETREPRQSRENSPVRKRVVRLSATPVGATRVHRRSNSISGSAPRQPPQRPASRASVDEKKESAPDVNTPAQSVRRVRMVSGSSGRARRGSSVTSSRRGYASSHHSDHEGAEEPATVNKRKPSLSGAEEPATVNKPEPNSTHGSATRPEPMTVARVRQHDVPPPQSRIKSISRGSLSVGGALSAPPQRFSRRGRARVSVEAEQIEEDDGDHPVVPSTAEPNSQDQEDDDSIEIPLPHILSYRDLAASGSPSSSAASRRKASSARGSPETQEAPKLPPNEYKLRLPQREQPVAQDKENDPPPTFKKKPSVMSLRQEEVKLLKPLQVDLDVPARSASPPRKPLSSINKNTPLRAAPPPPPPKMSVLGTSKSSTSGSGTAVQSKKRNMLKLNSKYYTRINCLGRGGSAKVYRVMTDNGGMLAMKRVATEGADEAQIRGYKGEIDLLRKLSGVDRVINLLDYEMNEERQLLSLLMEVGDIDFNTILREKQGQVPETFDPVWTRFYWKEMLECVASIHQHDVVHSDLKPANFVSVHSRLKLIDFGIANAIETNETVNVHRDTQVGTPNYMSPESLMDSNQAGAGGARMPGQPKLMKLGKPSDIWSLGCILYQLVYGIPPFGHIANQYARCHAIINWNHPIEFPDTSTGGMRVPHSLLRTMKRCLSRDVHLRPTAEELLAPTDPWLYPIEIGSDAPALPMTEDLLGRIIQSVVLRCREGMPSEATVMGVWPQAYWASAKKHVGGKEGGSAGGNGAP